MKPITPNKEMFLLSQDVREAVFGKYQPEYMPLPSIITGEGKVITQWELEPNDLELIKNGVPITLILYTFNQPLQPVMLMVGGTDLRETCSKCGRIK